VFSKGAFWVNGYAAACRAESKLLQLHHAAKVGFRVPRTLVSNDVDAIRDFVNGCDGAIRKSLLLFQWLEDKRSHSTLASSISADDLVSEPPRLPYCDIYQERIRKRSEIRAFLFGGTFFAVEISPGQSKADLVDFRTLHESRGNVAVIDFPQELKSACLRLLQALGLVSAVIEVMIDENGDFVFTEINQAGQFLWIMNHFPDSAILDAFVDFLISADPNFERIEQKSDLTLSAIRETEIYEELLAEEKEGLCPEPFAGV
jgi:hypothetical protein